MGVFSLFSSSKFSIETFEKELNDIYSHINKKNLEIIRLNQVKKSVVKNLYFYASIVYTLFVSVLIVKLPHNSYQINVVRWFLMNQLKKQLLALLGIPIITYLVKIMFTYFIDLLIRSRDKSVRLYKKKQKEKIDELKKLTNFNTTNELLSKYDSKKPNIQAKSTNPKVPSSSIVPPKMAAPTTTKTTGKSIPDKVSNTNADPSSKRMSNPGPIPPNTPTTASQKRTIQDRIFDLLIGSEDDSIENRYALICRKCYGHCGLAPPNTKDPQSIKYICPFCKTLNGEELDLASMMKDPSPEPVNTAEKGPTQSSIVKPIDQKIKEKKLEREPEINTLTSIKEGPEAEITN